MFFYMGGASNDSTPVFQSAAATMLSEEFRFSCPGRPPLKAPRRRDAPRKLLTPSPPGLIEARPIVLRTILCFLHEFRFGCLQTVEH